MPVYIPEEFTPEMLDAVIASLEDATARIRAVREVMRTLEIKKIPIKNSKEMKNKGLPKISLFAQAAVDAIREKQLGS